MKKYELYLDALWHHILYVKAKTKMWIIKEIVHFVSFITKDKEMRQDYIRMNYNFHRV